MSEEKSKDWYTPKDIYEMVQGLKEDMHQTRMELQETRAAVAHYNNLRKQVAQCQAEILTLQQHSVGQNMVWSRIRNWTAIIIAAASLILAYARGR